MSLLEDLFITVVNMSITASCVAVGVIFIRLLLKKAPKIFSYILWAPVLFRLVCPFSFDSAFSLFNLVSLDAKQGSLAYGFVSQDTGVIRTPAIRVGIGGIDNVADVPLPAAVPGDFPAAGTKPIQAWLAVLSLVWILGVISLLTYSIVSYVKTRRKLRTATLVEGNVFETDAVETAVVCGFIRPKIYVPVNIGDTDLSYILENERTHIRRKDHLVKPLAYLALILHWFNPLMWLCFSLMSRDMEMSCDESVLRKLGDSAKNGYSSSLLSLAVRRKGLLAANPLAFGENHVKTRIKNILDFKKPAFWGIAVAVTAVCAAVIAFTANPPEKEAIPGSIQDAGPADAEQAAAPPSTTPSAPATPSDVTPAPATSTSHGQTAATSTDHDQIAAAPSDPAPPELDPTLYMPSVNEGQYELLVEVRPSIPMHKVTNTLLISITNLSEEEYRSKFLYSIEQFDGEKWVAIPRSDGMLGQFPSEYGLRGIRPKPHNT